MAITNAGDFPIIASSTSGSALADILNRFYQAYQTNQSNAARPLDLQVGGLWTRFDGASLSLMMYNGNTDVVITQLNGDRPISGDNLPLALEFNPNVPYIIGDVIYVLDTNQYFTAKRSLSPAPFQIGDWQPLSDIFNDLLDANVYRKYQTYTKAEVDALISAINTTISGNYYTKAEVDQRIAAAVANYLPLSGGTVNGNLRVNGAITASNDVLGFS